MKLAGILLSTAMGLGAFSGSAAATEHNFGLGMGSNFNGVGAYYGMNVSDAMVYASAGCLALVQTSGNDFNSDCGVGAGYLNTALLFPGEGKHAVGVHVGSGYNTVNDDSEFQVFVAPQYVYYVNGQNKPGAQFGGSVMLAETDGDIVESLMLNMGYQF
ncbi:hypothetical protein CS022_03940 [Veronia nyctiphanis]|uniref:Outer membrane protein beta-barrel domain-containing protein n=1 Tax=Veronia nyctiphanis TaxID=1278244 RepID=A0A4Q0YSK7_9GAMM|nr:hypothetical protein [Veronia nyctiphanis]RXJ74227.1 hypothetical protein CS022_03940 [Veronia nyctiphanis]